MITSLINLAQLECYSYNLRYFLLFLLHFSHNESDMGASSRIYHILHCSTLSYGVSISYGGGFGWVFVVRVKGGRWICTQTTEVLQERSYTTLYCC